MTLEQELYNDIQLHNDLTTKSMFRMYFKIINTDIGSNNYNRTGKIMDILERDKQPKGYVIEYNDGLREVIFEDEMKPLMNLIN